MSFIYGGLLVFLFPFITALSTLLVRRLTNAEAYCLSLPELHTGLLECGDRALAFFHWFISLPLALIVVPLLCYRHDSQLQDNRKAANFSGLALLGVWVVLSAGLVAVDITLSQPALASVSFALAILITGGFTSAPSLAVRLLARVRS